MAQPPCPLEKIGLYAHSLFSRHFSVVCKLRCIILDAEDCVPREIFYRIISSIVSPYLSSFILDMGSFFPSLNPGTVLWLGC